MSSRTADRSAQLRTHHLVAVLITAHAPLTLLWAVVPTALLNGQVVATPLIFVLAGVILLGFVLGYSGLARRVRHPGGLYVQVTRGLGKPVGLGAAAVLLAAYTGLIGGLYGFLGSIISALTSSVLGLDLPMSLAIVIGVAGVIGLGAAPLRVVVRVLLGVVVVQIAAVLWFNAAALSSPAGGEVSFAALEPGGLLSGAFGVAVVFAVTSFVGSEAGASYSDELADPQRSIPRATYLSYGVTTLVLVLSSWAVSVAVGPEAALTQAASMGPAFLPAVIVALVGAGAAGTVTDILLTLLVAGLIATGVTLQNATSRQLAGLARDGVIPSVFAVTRPGGRPPWAASLAQPVVAGVIALLAVAFAPGDVLPLWLVVACGLGATGVLTLASAATVVWFLRGAADEGGFLGWEGQVVAGFFSIVTTGFIFLYGVTRVGQVAPGSPAAADWLVAVMIAVVFAVGVVVALVVRVRKPASYASIGGRGATTTAAPPTPDQSLVRAPDLPRQPVRGSAPIVPPRYDRIDRRR